MWQEEVLVYAAPHSARPCDINALSVMSTDRLISNVSFTKWKSMSSLTRTAARSNLNLQNKVEFTHSTAIHRSKGQLRRLWWVIFVQFFQQLAAATHYITWNVYSACSKNAWLSLFSLSGKVLQCLIISLQHIKPLREMFLPPEKHLLQALPLWNNGVICLMFEEAQTRLKGRDSYNDNVFSPVTVPREHP